MLANPVEDLAKVKFTSSHRAVDELVPFLAADVNVRAVATQENIRCGEGDTLIALNESAIVCKDSIKAAASSSIEL